MDKSTMLKTYHKFDKSESYIIGFLYEHKLWMSESDKIRPCMVKVEYTSSAKGKKKKIQLRLKAKTKKSLIKKGALCLGDENVLNDNKYNKGVMFEKIISEKHGIQFRGKDSVGFWIQGDLTIDNKEVQVKLDGAQIALESTLIKLAKAEE